MPTVGGLGGDPHVTTLDFINGMNLSGLNRRTQLAATTRSLGSELKQTLGNLISRQFRIAFAVEQSPDRQQSSDIVVGDRRFGFAASEDYLQYFRLYEAGFCRCVSPEEADLRKLGALRRISPRLLKTILPPSTSRRHQTRSSTYGGAGHVMGTYRMGTDPKTSVVDSFQRSHDHPNLYLVGSGTFPTVGTANPTLTFSAGATDRGQHCQALKRAAKRDRE